MFRRMRRADETGEMKGITWNIVENEWFVKEYIVKVTGEDIITYTIPERSVCFENLKTERTE